MSLLQKAEEIARDAHAGQLDKAGQPYINHPIAVSEAMPTVKLKIIALLHDVVEDNSEYTFKRLRSEGFGDEIITPLKYLTRGKNEDYEDYIHRVGENESAVTVKLADLKHNSDRTRIPNPSVDDLMRYAKYERAIEYLETMKF